MRLGRKINQDLAKSIDRMDRRILARYQQNTRHPAWRTTGAFAREWFESNDNVMRYETLVVLDRVKAGVSLPVATE